MSGTATAAVFPRLLSHRSAHRLLAQWATEDSSATLPITPAESPILLTFLNGADGSSLKKALGHAGFSALERVGPTVSWMLVSVPTLAVPMFIGLLQESELGLASDLLGRAWSLRTAPPATKNLLLARGRVLELSPGKTVVMGVVNVTPDSFFAGSRTEGVDQAVRRGLELRHAGALVLDIGGESTRPGAEEVPVDVEIERVVPVIRRLRGEDPDLYLSVDTRKSEVAAAAVEAGADLVNDVTAGREDPRILQVVEETGAGIALMHMQGTPSTMQVDPAYDDVVAEVCLSLWGSARLAERAGISRDRILLDPGIGFGKKLEHNLALLEGMGALQELGYPVLLGTSRKSFLGSILGKENPEDRLAGTLATVAVAAWQGVEMVRVHDALEAEQVTQVVEAISQASSVPEERGA